MVRVLTSRDDGDFFRFERLDAYRAFELDCGRFFFALVVDHARLDGVRGSKKLPPSGRADDASRHFVDDPPRRGTDALVVLLIKARAVLITPREHAFG